jgi:hypothetical protein
MMRKLEARVELALAANEVRGAGEPLQVAAFKRFGPGR